jgi:hypothetical protein
MLRVAFSFCLVILFGIILDSCEYHDLTEPVPCGAGLTLKDDIYPIVIQRCAVDGCHNGSTPLPNWSDTTLFKQNITKVRNRVASGSMPKNNQTEMTEEERQKVVCWADEFIN